VNCEKYIKRKLGEIKRIKFPIVYDASEVENAEILLFKSQYEKYGLDIPEELKEVIGELSECE
jgi:hypothetical protein